MAMAVQGSLFGCSERKKLSDGAWIDVHAGWLTGADELLCALMSAVLWRAERRLMYDHVVDVPRLVSFHDLTVEDAPHPLLLSLLKMFR